jgi:hypothetical protein
LHANKKNNLSSLLKELVGILVIVHSLLTPTTHLSIWIVFFLVYILLAIRKSLEKKINF